MKLKELISLRGKVCVVGLVKDLVWAKCFDEGRTELLYLEISLHNLFVTRLTGGAAVEYTQCFETFLEVCSNLANLLGYDLYTVQARENSDSEVQSKKVSPSDS